LTEMESGPGGTEVGLKSGELRQASEKIWGACALAIKALGKGYGTLGRA
jgi:hypothetical protein